MSDPYADHEFIAFMRCAALCVVCLLGVIAFGMILDHCEEMTRIERGCLTEARG